MTSNKERDLFWCLDIKDQLKLWWAWVKRSSGIIMRILRIIMILKALKVSFVGYMWIHIMWECSNKERDLFKLLDIKDQLKLLWAWVKRSSGIIMRILRIIMILKALKVSFVGYMWIHIMWECSNKERDLFKLLDIKDQLKLLWAWVKRSSGIIMRILRIIMILKALKVSFVGYMWIHIMWECSNKERDLFKLLDIKDQLKLLYTWLSEVVP